MNTSWYVYYKITRFVISVQTVVGVVTVTWRQRGPSMILSLARFIKRVSGGVVDIFTLHQVSPQPLRCMSKQDSSTLHVLVSDGHRSFFFLFQRKLTHTYIVLKLSNNIWKL
jgi:hypothetical protein